MFNLVIMNEQFLEKYEYKCKFTFALGDTVILDNEHYQFTVNFVYKSVIIYKKAEARTEEHTFLSLHNI